MYLQRLVVFAAVIVFLGSCSQDPRALYESAKSRRDKGDRAGAVVQLKSAIQGDPDNPAMRHSLAQLYLELRDGTNAEKELRKAVELGKKDRGELAADLAQALWMQGNATGILKEIVVPDSPDVDPAALVRIHVFRGRSQAQLGRIPAARESLTHASAAAGGKSLPALSLLEAEILAREHRTEDAIRTLDAVLQTHPRLYDALLVKAEVLRASGKDDEAILALNALLSVYPADLDGLVARSSMFLQKGQWNAAEKDVNSLRQEHPQHYFTSFQDGLLRFRKGQFRIAIEAFNATLKRNPNFDLPYLYLGMAHLALGEARQAERILSAYSKVHPENRTARHALASALIDINEPARALEVIAPAMGNVGQSSFLDLAAEAHYRLGELDKAGELFAKAAQRAGEGSLADEKRAITRLRAGQHEAALEDFARIAKARKKISKVDIALAIAHVRKDPSQALALIEELDRKAPRQPFLYNLKGRVLLEKGEHDAAIAAFNEALKIQPAFFPAAANLYKLDVEQGKLEQGRERFVSVLKADRNHYQALLALSEVEQTLGKAKEALALVERATIAHPKQTEPWVRLISMHLRRADHENARRVAQDFLNRNASSFIAAEMMGKVQLAQGDSNSAVATYTRLTTEYPKSERAHLALAEAQLTANRVSDAERSLRRILEINPDHREGQLAWVGLMVREKRVDEAKRYAQALQKERRNSAAGWVLEADIARAQSKFGDAAKALTSALSMTPRDDLAIRRYETQVKAGDAKGALSELQQFVDKRPEALSARVHLAEILARAGDFAAAAKHYEPASKSPAVNPMVLNNLAYTYYKLNDPRALSVSEQAYRAIPNNPLVLDTLGLILLRDGDSKRALGLLEKAVKQQPNHPELRYHLAMALHKSGDKDRAKAELTQLLEKHKKFPEREEAVALLKAIGGA